MIVEFARNCAELLALLLFVVMVSLWASLLNGGFSVA